LDPIGEKRANLVKVLDFGEFTPQQKDDWFLRDLMKELIEDGCDINIAVDKIPLVLYALK